MSCQLCQDAIDKDLAFSLGTYQWLVNNNDPDNLNFEIHYAGGDKDKGLPRYNILYIHFC